jgi:hypothetical protein
MEMDRTTGSAVWISQFLRSLLMDYQQTAFGQSDQENFLVYTFQLLRKEFK